MAQPLIFTILIFGFGFFIKPNNNSENNYSLIARMVYQTQCVQMIEAVYGKNLQMQVPEILSHNHCYQQSKKLSEMIDYIKDDISKDPDNFLLIDQALGSLVPENFHDFSTGESI